MLKCLPLRLLSLAGVLGFSLSQLRAQTAPTVFTPLQQLPAPKMIASAAAYPGQYQAENLIDGDAHTEYASNGKGTNTFIEMEFEKPEALAGFRHVDRNDPATVAESELVFMDNASNIVSRLTVKHVNERGGATFTAFAKPIRARRVLWRVTGLGAGLATVGGAELAFFTTGPAESQPSNISIVTRALQLRERAGENQVQPLKVLIKY